MGRAAYRSVLDGVKYIYLVSPGHAPPRYRDQALNQKQNDELDLAEFDSDDSEGSGDDSDDGDGSGNEAGDDAGKIRVKKARKAKAKKKRRKKKSYRDAMKEDPRDWRQLYEDGGGSVKHNLYITHYSISPRPPCSTSYISHSITISPRPPCSASPQPKQISI